MWHELEQHTEFELLRQTGGVIIGPEGTPEILCATASAEDNNLPHEALDAATLRPRFPQQVVRDSDVGVTDPLAGYLRPEASVATAVERASALGAAANTYTEVVAVEPPTAGVAVVTRAGEQTHDRVVLTPGPGEGRHIKFGTHPEVPDLAHVDRSVDLAFASQVAAVVREFLPGLHPDPVSLQTGVEGFSPDGMPLLGLAPSDARLVVACGFSGSGFKLAPVMGEIAADFAMVGSTGRDVSYLAPDRHLREPSTST